MSALNNSKLSSKSFRRFKVVKPQPYRTKQTKTKDKGLLSKFEKELMTLEQDKNFFTKKNFDLIAENVT